MAKRAVFKVAMTWEGDTDAGFEVADKYLDLLIAALEATPGVVAPGITSYLEVDDI